MSCPDPEMSDRATQPRRQLDRPCDGPRTSSAEGLPSPFLLALVSLFIFSPSSSHQSGSTSDLRLEGQLRRFMSSASTCSPSRTCFSSEFLLGESNTWNMILDFSFHCNVGGILRDLGWSGATAISGTCPFLMLLAPIRQALVWPVFATLCGES